MLIENMMYFALGALAAGLIALIVMPAVWKRAVRLTRRRIEAATPISMAEFRADKDQLRAQFALSTRRLEMHIEQLRTRLAEQQGDAELKSSDLGALQLEREERRAAVQELEARQTELRNRILELEKENTDLSQNLRQRDRDLALRESEIADLRDQASNTFGDAGALAAAEAHMASAESQLSELLAEAGTTADGRGPAAEQMLADTLNREDETEIVRQKVAELEATLTGDNDNARPDDDRLRERLDDIAASVSQLVYAADNDDGKRPDFDESLFDRIARFADDGETEDFLPVAEPSGQRGAVSDRLTALREIQGR